MSLEVTLQQSKFGFSDLCIIDADNQFLHPTLVAFGLNIQKPTTYFDHKAR